MRRDYSLLGSFRYAFQGLKEAFKKEPNMKLHVFIGFCAIVLAWFFSFTTFEWAILILTIFIVISLELINTVLETLTDIVSPQIAEKARIAKDVSAGAVFIAALAAFIVGCFLFGPKLFKIF